MSLVDGLVFSKVEVRSLIGPILETLPPAMMYASRYEVSRGFVLVGTTDEQKVYIMLWLVVYGVM